MFRGLLMRLWLLGPLVMCGLVVSPKGVTFSSVMAAEDTAPTATVEKLHGALIDSMKKGKALGFAGRVSKIDPIVAETFDIAAMARISTGGAWAKMSDAEHADITKAFSDWTVATYAGNFAEFDGESFTTKSQSADDGKGNILVNTRLDAKGIPPVLLNYRLHKVNGTWKIFDIYLDGAISQLAMRRAEFSAVLARGNPAGLVQHMNKLAADAKKDG